MLRREVRRRRELWRTAIQVWTTSRRLRRPDQVVQAEADLGAELRHNFLVVVLEFLGELRLRVVKILRATADAD